MGCGEIDGSYREQLFNPSMNTTDLIKEELDNVDFVLHIGDMSYAQGYAAIVSVMHTSTTRHSFMNELRDPQLSIETTMVLVNQCIMQAQCTYRL